MENTDKNSATPVQNAAPTVEDKIVEVLRTVYDPEIPVNIYDLGLVYSIDYHPEDGTLDVDMTLTAPGCPMADYIVEDVRQKLSGIGGVTSANVNLVFEPEWNQDMMSDEAKADLGLL
jgi:FeS assembly SUF system protein